MDQRTKAIVQAHLTPATAEIIALMEADGLSVMYGITQEPGRGMLFHVTASTPSGGRWSASDEVLHWACRLCAESAKIPIPSFVEQIEAAEKRLRSADGQGKCLRL